VFALVAELPDSETPDRDSFDLVYGNFVSAQQPLLLVAEADGAVSGYALISVTRHLYTGGASAQLQEIVVGESVQGAGIGSALIEAIEKECIDRGVGELTVPSRRSAGFYERLGYLSTASYLKRTFE
jgi:GNAT superfamily N-acetyltransferase